MTFLFYIFAALALVGGIGVVINKNPVSSAFAMILSFMGLAALFIQLDAYLVGILQILVYAGAIMVLFLFIIMLLDVKAEEKKPFSIAVTTGAVLLVGILAALILKVLNRYDSGGMELGPLSAKAAKATDVKEIGNLLFETYWFPVQIVGVLLLVATVGVVILSKREVR